MGYAIIGVNKINSLAKLNAASEHNLRQVDVPNADKDMAYKNDELVLTNGKSYGELYRERISSLEYYKDHKPRSNAVIALEVRLSFSHEDSEKIDIEKWKKDNVEWLRGYFNRNPLTYGDSPIALPISEKSCVRFAFLYNRSNFVRSQLPSLLFASPLLSSTLYKS